MARIFDAGIDFGIDACVQSLVLCRFRLWILSRCRAAAAAFLSARISFEEAISKDDVLSVGSDLGTAHHCASRRP